ncbi:LytR/AlgR family response regulator transcription factor [Pseudoalteromonas prydzensis]|uniref:LytR/AlgR family response regulator transcription factor n=1 Tax=Pseudoalteromonas prydzensis TaxID=182141 RepID=UPI003FD52B32
MQHLSIKITIYILLNFLLVIFSTQGVLAKKWLSIDTESVISCPVKTANNAAVNFDDPQCETLNFYEVNPQNKHLWIKANLQLEQQYLDLKQANAFFLFAKASSEVYFNGIKIGQNGTPHNIPEQEFVGKMDAKFYLPKQLLKLGNNEVVINLSSHHGYLTLSSPMHFAGIGEYASSTRFFHQNMLLSVLILGILLVGVVYLVALGLQSTEIKITFFMVFFVLVQLYLELSRGLFNYDYPFQDLRLLLVVTCALGFGACLMWFFLIKLRIKQPIYYLVLSTATTLVIVCLLPWYDIKTVVAVLAPATIITALLGWHCFKLQKKELIPYFIIFLLFDAIALLTLPTFHNIVFYSIITTLMIALFIKQAQELVAYKVALNSERDEVAKLKFRLAQKQQRQSPPKLTLNSAGKTEHVATEQIIFCKAAGDYVEIHLTENKQRLYSGSLKGLAEELPNTFMKVHRSYIVNLDYIDALHSACNKAAHNNPQQVHLLVQQHQIPVSRRLLPQVREIIRSS